MIIGKAIYARLTGDSTVNPTIAGRCFPLEAPKPLALFPRIVYLGDDAEGETSYVAPAGNYRQKVTIACQALSYSSADALAALVLASLDGLSGSFGGLTLQGVFLENQRDQTYESAETAEQQLIFSSELDFLFVYHT